MMLIAFLPENIKFAEVSALLPKKKQKKLPLRSEASGQIAKFNWGCS
jgi:hypothetical protein